VRNAVQSQTSTVELQPERHAESGPRLTSAFGWRTDPFTGREKFHKGIDLAAVYGQDVQAARAGRVAVSGAQGGYGTTIVIEHPDGTRSRYAHLSATLVEPGTMVEAGQLVGRAGNSGRATGTHLHFEVTGADGQPLSPSTWSNGRIG
jgi:murein DD-endopeptidase MepM/ murein hydrolase activator NlpD